MLRLGWVIALVVVFGVVGVAGYGLYRYQSKQNTFRLLRDARAARDVLDWPRAAADYRQYVRRSPTDRQALGEYVDVLLQRTEQAPESMRDAVPALRRLVALSPGEIAPVKQLANLYLDLGQPSLASEFARRWLELEPDSTDAVLTAARADYGCRRPSQAVEVFKQALARRPNEPRLYPPLIELLSESLDRPYEAEEWVHNALEAAPDSADVQMAAFAFYHGQRRFADAEPRLKRSLELNPDSPETLARAAMFYVSIGRLEEAAPHLARAKELAPNHRLVFAVRAIRAIRLNDVTELRATAEDLLASTGRDSERTAQAAELFIRAGDRDKADELIQRLAASSSLSPKLDTWLDTLRGASAILAARPYLASTFLERSLRKDPSSVWAMELLASCYLQIGALDEAASLYRSIITLSPQTAGARVALAAIELDRGRCDDALQALEHFGESVTPLTVQADLIKMACELSGAERTKPDSARVERMRVKLDAISASPSLDPLTLQLLAQCLVSAGERDRATRLVVEWNGPPATKLAAAAQFGRTLLLRGSVEHALRCADEIVKQFPREPQGHVLRVQSLAAAGRLPDAKAYAASAEPPQEFRPQLLGAYGQAAIEQEQVEEGLPALREAAALAPENVSIREILIRFASSLAEVQAISDEIRRIEGDDGVHWRFQLAAGLLRYDPTPQASKQAMELLQSCLAVRPGWTFARLLFAYARERVGDLMDAAESYRTVFAQHPEFARQPVALRYVEVLRSLGRTPEADAALDQLVSALPNSPDVLRLEVDRQIREQDLSGAASTAERALHLEPVDAAWAAATADLQIRAGNPARAEAIARDGLVSNPDSLSLMRSLSRALFLQNRAAEAESLLRAAADRPGKAMFHLILAELLVQQNQLERAHEEVSAALRDAPNDVAIAAASAEFYAARGERGKQIDLYRKIITLRGEDPRVSLPLAAILASGAPMERQEAEAITKRCLDANPKDISAMLISATIAVQSDPPRFMEAETTLKKAISLQPQDVRAAKAMAAMYARQGRTSLAADVLTNALAAARDDPDLLLALSEVELMRGNSQQALISVRRLLDLRPRNEGGQRLLVDVCRQSGDLERCAEYFQKIPEGQRTSAELISLSVVLDEKNEVARAEEVLRGAYSRNPRDATTFQALARFLGQHNRCDDLYALSSERRERFPDNLDSIIASGELLASRCQRSEWRRAGLGWLEEIAQNHPEKAADAFFRAGLAEYLQGDLTRAETMLLKSSQLMPSAARAVNALAWLYSEDRGQPQRALDLIERYLSDGGTPNAEMLDTSAAALLQLGRLDAARQKLNAALEIAGVTPTRTAATYRLALVMLQSDDPQGRMLLRQALDFDRRLGGLSAKEKREAIRLSTQSTGKPSNEN